MRWRLKKRPGRLGGLGHDFDRGHRTYVEQMGPAEELWLRTKPFRAPPSEELDRCLHTFPHVIRELNLGLRAQVLDVGCGPGWLSELLARSGYWVTGIDISEDMISIAEDRIAAIPRPLGEAIDEPAAEFFAMPVREMPWSDRFDGAVMFDTLHHFDDELETLCVIHRTLVPGGRIYIEEGVRPPPGSEAEGTLIAEMEAFGTLESPFDPEYLVEVLEQAGFEDVRRFARIDSLFEIGARKDAISRMTRQLQYPDLNTVTAVKPVHEAIRAPFRGRIEQVGDWEVRDSELTTSVRVTNIGGSYWPVASSLPPAAGVVTVAPFLRTDADERLELPRGLLPQPVPPDGAATVPLSIPTAAVAGAREIEVDLVREGLAWFSDLGSEPLPVPLPTA